MRRCAHPIALVRSESCGIPLRLIPIDNTTTPECFPVPCAFTPIALTIVTARIESLGVAPYTPGDSRRFKMSLQAIGFFRCEMGPIDRPDLWLQAMTQTALRNGEHFAETYSNLLRAI